MEGAEEITLLHLAFLASSIVTYVADVTLDVVLALTYVFDGYYHYALVTVLLTVGPTLLVQFFSARWHQEDGALDRARLVTHAAMAGLVHRYVEVISVGLRALRDGAAADVAYFYRHQSNACILRLFDSFLESAPQLVFHLYVMLERNLEWPAEKAAWTSLSAIASMVSLGWGIASYSSAMRTIRPEKRNLSWLGMILQTLWRFGMLSARIVALVLITVTVREWVVIVLFVHWLAMFAWIVYQNTDFCSTQWEERVYNAVMAVVYCFCFFNLKEGQSRYRVTLFYVVVIAENLAFVTVFSCYSDFRDPLTRQNMAIAAFTFVTAGVSLGLVSMLLYYRFFHPQAESERPELCIGLGKRAKDRQMDDTKSPAASPNLRRTPPAPPARKKRVEHSRSLKQSFSAQQTPKRKPRSKNNNEASPCSSDTSATSAARHASSIVNGFRSAATVPDSAYGTDSNRTHSRSTNTVEGSVPSPATRSGSSLADHSGESNSSQAFNNETYMSVEMGSPEGVGVRPQQSQDATSDFSQCSADSRITVINRKELYATPVKKRTAKSDTASDAHPEGPLKRSPVFKDMTRSGPPVDGLTAPLTIIVPNISHQAFARTNSGDLGDHSKRLPDQISIGKSGGSVHDYENLALVNINRMRPMQPGSGGNVGAGANLISHWRAYSNMASGDHDESTARDPRKVDLSKGNSDYSNYSSLQYYDIYPLSRQLKEQLYRSLTPVSTTATVASDSNTLVSDSDTYEPIEAYSVGDAAAAPSTAQLPVTLIHHDGQSTTTKQLVSLENLKDILKQHETIPMDDPQERGDLYLLAPMRLLTPILEEPEYDVTRGSESTLYAKVGQQVPAHHLEGAQHGPSQISRSLLSVISDILNNSYPTEVTQANSGKDTLRLQGSSSNLSRLRSSSGKLNETGEPSSTLAANRRSFSGVAASSSLVHTIDEVKNKSMCNLFFTSDISSSNSSNEVDDHGDGGCEVAPQVPPRNHQVVTVVAQTPDEVCDVEGFDLVQRGREEEAGDCAASVFARDTVLNGSLKSIRSNTLVPCSPGVNDRQSISTVKKRPSQLPIPTTDIGESDGEEIKPRLPARRNSASLMRASAGSRKNLMELTAGDSTDILNTPRRPTRTPPSLSAPMSVSQPTTPTRKAPPQHNTIGLPQPRLLELSMSLSPSSKYETPTPPLRPNQFVRTSNVRMPTRRRVSILRQCFQDDDGRAAPYPQGALSASYCDLYQNVSDGDLLHNDLSEIAAANRSASTPFLDSRKFELRADERYDDVGERGAAALPPSQVRCGWATSSARYKSGEDAPPALARRRQALQEAEDDDQENRPPKPGPKPPSSALSSRKVPLNVSHGGQIPVIPSSSCTFSPLYSAPMTPVGSAWSPHLAGASHRRLTGSLSPKARIFRSKCQNV